MGGEQGEAGVLVQRRSFAPLRLSCKAGMPADCHNHFGWGRPAGHYRLPSPVPPHRLAWYCTSMQNRTAACTSLNATWNASPSAAAKGHMMQGGCQPRKHYSMGASRHAGRHHFSKSFPDPLEQPLACPLRTCVDLVAVEAANQLPNERVVHLLHLRWGAVREQAAGWVIALHTGRLQCTAQCSAPTQCMPPMA